jgi:glycerol-3-phosphate dehydrogenase (NAD(P)+)
LETIGIIGAGAWGTALAATLQRAGRKVVLWAREPEIVESIRTQGRNTLFLPEITLDGVVATGDLAAAAAADAVLLVVPAQFLRATCRQLRPHWRSGAPAVLCAKGIETDTGATMSETASAELPGVTLAVLSGPTFAIEVAQGLPTAITLACGDSVQGQRLVTAIGTSHFRPYLTDDVVGVEMGGAVKNVLAIACGV